MIRPRFRAAAFAFALPFALAACSGNAAKTPAQPQQTAQPTSPDQPTSQEPPMKKEATPEPATRQTAYLGGGCFWCVEAVLERIDGVLDVESGYMGGEVDNPTYRQVCDGDTGHAEIVKVDFDPAKISYRQLLDWFFLAHDPTTKNRQGNDIGTQYRSVVFFVDDAQRQVAEQAKAAANEKHKGRVVTEITKAAPWWPAEEYHQDFFERNPSHPYCNALIPPKLDKLGLREKPKNK